MIGSSPALDVLEEPEGFTVLLSSSLAVESESFAGEMGMVSRGTGDLGASEVGAVSRVAILISESKQPRDWRANKKFSEPAPSQMGFGQALTQV